MDNDDPFVQKRMFERIPVNIQARFFYGNIFYSGKIRNLSENGMFIHTKIPIPVKAIFPVIIRTDTMLLNILGRVRWSEEMTDQNCGIGLEIVNPSQNYIEYTENIRTR